MKKSSIAISVAAAAFLAACGESTTENITNINQTGMEVVKSAKDLPECTEENEGAQAFVKGESAARICVDGEWFATQLKDTTGDADFSCTTKELADKSGLKIVCNGDSIGVVLNGAKGDKGDDGKQGIQGEKGDSGDAGKDGDGCSISSRSDSTVTIVCGGKTMVVNLGSGVSIDSLGADSTISLEALEGYTQKGPFLKGSSVYLYELNGSLNQTNGNFTSVITNDDGRYRFRTRGLKYPYAMVVVDGYYRNEVTGGISDAPIRLRAITDVSSRVTGSTNVNLLTHLEYDRVNILATGPGKLKLKEAKHKAQTEILDAFHFDTNLVKNVQSEDMDVFGKSEADAALLAISILLQGDGSASDLSVLLTELADDLVDGKWDGAGSDTLKSKLADWAFNADFSGRLRKFRGNVKKWGLSDTVPEFEKYVRRFWNVEKNFVGCNKANEGSFYKTPYKKATLLLKCEDGVWSTRGMKDSRDGHEYRIVKIGDQVWMAENLDFEYRVKPTDGDPVVYGNNCYLNNCYSDSSMLFGRYYSWAAAMDSAGIYSANGRGCGAGVSCLPAYPVQGICPEGWHLPDSTEWEQLYSAMERDADGMLAEGWMNIGAKLTSDNYGFSVYQAGHYEYSRSTFENIGWYANFWSATEGSFWIAPNWFVSGGESRFGTYGKRNGFAVRCVKGGGSSSASTILDIDTLSSTYLGYNCGDLWCGGTDVMGRVITGSEEETSGYWFEFSDAKDKGTSRIQYPADVEENAYGNFFGPLTEAYGGIRGTVTLGDGYEYPYIGLAFNIWNEKQEGADIRDWDGLCLVYKSTIGFALELVVQDEETVTEYDNYRASVPKAPDSGVVDYSWEKFKQGNWGKVVERDTVLSKTATIKLIFEGSAGTAGDFFIQSIGRLGTCK